MTLRCYYKLRYCPGTQLKHRCHHGAQIRQLAFHDKLTGLPNRALFGDRLTQALAMARRDENQVALLYLDLAVQETGTTLQQPMAIGHQPMPTPQQIMTTVQQIMMDADVALYQANDAGRGASVSTRPT
jgi:PleD family two-component response regulator